MIKKKRKNRMKKFKGKQIKRKSDKKTDRHTERQRREEDESKKISSFKLEDDNSHEIHIGRLIWIYIPKGRNLHIIESLSLL